MKFKKIMFFSLVFIFLFSFSLSVLGQSAEADIAQQAEETTAWLSGQLKYGFTFLLGVPDYADVGEFAIYLIVFAILIVAFADILQIASPFSTHTSYIIGVGLGILAGLFGVIRWFATWALTVAAVWGTIAVVFSLFIAFGAFLFGGGILRRLKVWKKIGRLEEKGKLKGGALNAAIKMAEEALKK